MIGGVLLQRKSYGMIDYLASATLSFGLAVFTLADVTVNPNYNLTGVILISMALCADAVIGKLYMHFGLELCMHLSWSFGRKMFSMRLPFIWILSQDNRMLVCQLSVFKECVVLCFSVRM